MKPMESKKLNPALKLVLIVWSAAALTVRTGAAQALVMVPDSTSQYIFSFNEIVYLEDSLDALGIDEVSSPSFSGRFKVNKDFSPKNFNKKSSYWYRIQFKFPRPQQKDWFIEFFDQTIDEIALYLPDGQG